MSAKNFGYLALLPLVTYRMNPTSFLSSGFWGPRSPHPLWTSYMEAPKVSTRLIFGQGPVHTPVGNPEGVTRKLLLRVEELVEETDMLHEITADRPHQVVEIIRAISVRLRDPEADVVYAWGLLTHRLKVRNLDLYSEGKRSALKMI